MSDRVRCNCQQCAIRGLMGPAILVTLGILFLLDQLRGGYFSFGNTFPVILIVIGLAKVIEYFQRNNSNKEGFEKSEPI